jgi:hypothetical protein
MPGLQARPGSRLRDRVLVQSMDRVLLTSDFQYDSFFFKSSGRIES